MVGRGGLLAGGAAAAALAIVLSAPVGAQDPPRALLPDLRSRPQQHVTFDTIGIYGGTTVNGCFADEIVEDGARRCLRFDQSIANLGEGPFELRYAPPNYLSDPFMYQRIYRSDGSYEDRKAEQYEFHPTHAHFHYKGFAQSRLWQAAPDGARVGTAPVAVGRKNGFCVMDIERVSPDAPSKQYDGSGCTATQEWLNGITQGWADTYTADLPDQYMEVSGVPDGLYQLETITDPDNTVVEVSETNNTVAVLIRIKGNTVTYVRKAPEPAPEPSPPPPPPKTPPGPSPTPSSGGHSPSGSPSHSGGSNSKSTSKRRKATRRRYCKPTRKRASAKRSATTSAKNKPKRRCKKRRSSSRSRR